MRRIALVLLIALLPLQSIWVVAANACQQQCGAGGEHFGHHPHVHDGAADDASTDARGDAGDSNATDGSNFHGHGLSALILEDRSPIPSSRPGYLPSAYVRSFADRYLENPLRPPLRHGA